MADLIDLLRALARSEHDDHSIATDAAEEIERLRAELAAEIEACASIVEEHIVPVSNRYHGDEYATRAMAIDALRDAADAIRSRK